MRKLFIFALAALSAAGAAAQGKNFSFKFYGRVRADLFYNSRANNESVDGLFYMYPKDHNYDPDGNDLNGTAQGSFYSMYSRLGVDIGGPMIGKAKSSAKIELDFRGSGSTYSVARLRQAYVNLDWGCTDLLIGQTWHPMFGEVSPSILNLSTGAPFQPFNRSPLVRVRYNIPAGLRFTASAIWQSQYNSAGPEGKSHNYLKNGNIPEIFLGVDYNRGGFTAGIGGELLSLKPRQKSVVDGITYKVNERVTSLSGEAHVKYKAPMWTASAKTVLANNLTQASMLGGFGVTSVDERTGECEYTPFRHSMTWLNFVYGKKWQPGVFFGYLKNLGTSKPITGETYGVGLDVDQLFSSNWQISYNLKAWKIGVEFEASTAWYGNMDNADGRIRDTHSVTNYRVLGVVMFSF